MKLDKEEVIDEFLDEARFNLATRVMPNGVELIIANDKSKPSSVKTETKDSLQEQKKQHVPQQLDSVLSQSSFRPMTFAPSTLKNKMILVIPTQSAIQEKFYLPADLNQFVTKTCLTTYTYRTTYLQNGSTTVESREQVISNIATEERNYLQITPALSLGLTLTQTPALAVGIFPTTYSYYNTINDDDHPVVQLSKYTIVNTITGPDGYINFLQPSEEATSIYETNTYYSKLKFTNILQTTGAEKMYVTTNILTQVIVTESLAPRNSLLLKHVESSSAQINRKSDEILTYKNSEPIKHPTVLYETKSEYDMHIYTTKTFVTTLTYLKTTLVSGSDDENVSTMHRIVPSKKLKTSGMVEQIQNAQNVHNSNISYRTRIIENVISETVPSSLLKSEVVSKFRDVLKSIKPERRIFITTASLLNGETLEITAMHALKPSLATTKEELKNVIGPKQTIVVMSTSVPLQMIHTLSDTLSKGTKKNNTLKITTTATKIQSTSTELFNAAHAILDEDSLSADAEYNEIYSSKSPQFLKPSKPQKNQTIQHLVDNIIIATTTNNKNRLPVAVSQIIDSLNLQRLNALRPVINAMAGLLQGSFATASKQLQLVSSSSVPLSASTGTEIASIVSSTQMNRSNRYNYQEINDGAVIKQKKPIYIPVIDYEINSHKKQFSNIAAVSAAGDLLGVSTVQSLHLQSDADNKYLQQQGKQQTLSQQNQYANSLKKSQSFDMLTENNIFNMMLRNGGIPIRPGEVITANSDIIIGKPNGIQHPQIPLASNFANLEEQSQKLSVKNYHKMYKQHIEVFGGTNKPFMTSHISTIPLGHEPQNQYNNSKRKLILQQKNKLLSKLPAQQVIHNYYTHNNWVPAENYDYLLTPPPPAVHTALSNIEKLEPMSSSHITNFTVLKSVQPTRFLTPVSELHKSKKRYYAVNNNTHTNTQIYDRNLSSNINNNKLTKMHDLMMNTSKTYVNYHGKFQHAQHMENPVNERLSSEYSPYSYSALNASYDTVVLRQQTPKAPGVYAGTQANHQSINLHTHVFSHNVNMHAPPLTFKKETDYPKYATAVHGQIPKVAEGAVRYNMPLIKIPHNEKQVQINLTPQNVIEQINNPGVIAYTKDTTNTKSIFVENIADSSVIGSFSLYNSLPSDLTNLQQQKSKAQKPLRTQLNHNHAHLYIMAKNNNFTDNHNQSSNNKESVRNEYQRIFIPAAAGVTTSDTFTQQQYPQRVGYDVNMYATNGSANKELTDVIKNVTSVNHAIAGSLSTASLYYQPNNMIDKISYLKSANTYDTAVERLIDKNSKTGVLVSNNNVDNNVDQHTASATNSLHEKTRTEQQKVLQPFFSPFAAMEVSNTHPTLLEQLNGDITRNSSRNSTIPSSRKNVRPITYYLTRVTQEHTAISTKSPSQTPQMRLNEKKYTQNTQLLSRGAPFATQRLQILQNATQKQQKKTIYFAKGDSFKTNHETKATSVHTDDLASIVPKSKQEYKQTSKTREPNKNYKLTAKEQILYATTTMHLPKTISNKQPTKNETRTVNQRQQNLSSLSLPITSLPLPPPPKQQQPHSLTFPTVKPQTTVIHTSNTQDYETINLKSIWQTLLQSPPLQSTQKPSQAKNRYIGRTTALTQNRKIPKPIPLSKINGTVTHSVVKEDINLITSTNNFLDISTNVYSVINYNANKHVKPTATIRDTSSLSLVWNSSTVYTAFQIPGKHVKSPMSVQQSSEYESPLNTDVNIISKPHELVTLKPFLESSEAATISPSSGASLTDAFTLLTAFPNGFMGVIVEKSNLSQIDKTKSQWHLKYNSRTNIFSDTIFYKNIELFPTKYITRAQLITPSSTHSRMLTTTAYEQLQNDTFFDTKLQTTTTDNTITQTEWATKTITVTESESLTEKAKESDAKILETYTNIPAEPTRVTVGSILPIAEIIVSDVEGKTPDNIFNHANVIATMVSAEVLENENTNIHFNIGNYILPQYEPFTHTNQSRKTQNNNIKHNNSFVVYENDLNKINMGNRNEVPIFNISNTTTESVYVEPKNSIFIVMTNSQSNVKAKQPYDLSNVIRLDSADASSIGSIVSGAASDIDNIDTNTGTIQLDYEDSVSVFNLPTRDEQSIAEPHDSRTMINQVLLGGVLIATPPKLNISISPTAKNSTCLPPCKMARNEVCTLAEFRWNCVCRPGFARMFPDRPCKPTYTYQLSLRIDHYGDFKLFYDHSLADNSTDDYKHLATVTKEAINRMVMQSDLRDIYHGVQLSTFTLIYDANMDTGGKSTNIKSSDLSANLLLQLSENSDEERLMAVFKKYLRLTNYSIGGTKLFTDRNGVESLAITDFNECAHGNFHDCSSNALCFNLQGTYTCSCKENFADLSGNTVYPGRVCSAELVGCERCHYHGKCVVKKSDRPYASEHVVCECFAWYTGSTCQLNLKIVLIVLIAVGTLLFTLLMFCILLICTKRHTLRKKYHAPSQSDAGIHRITGIPSIGLISCKSTHGIRGCRSKHINIDKCAIIKDTSSESSKNTLLCVLKKDPTDISKKSYRRSRDPHIMTDSSSVHVEGQRYPPYGHIAQTATTNVNVKDSEKYVLNKHNSFKDSACKPTDQTDQPLTVMIPRAKYHASVSPQTELFHQHVIMEHTKNHHEQQRIPQKQHNKSDIATSMTLRRDNNCNIVQKQKKQSSKKLNIRGSKHVEVISGRNVENDDCELTNMHLHQLGALVSAGYEVSALVSENILITSSNEKNEQITLAFNPNCDIIDEFNSQKHRSNINIGDDVAKNDKFIDSIIDNNKRIVRLNQATLSPSEQQKQQLDQVKLVNQCSYRSSSENRSSGKDENNLLDSMDVWFGHYQRNKLSTEAQSLGESTVQTTVKPLHICFDVLTSNTNDDANTMAERDVGSTFLLPHTHLYEPDKEVIYLVSIHSNI
ncbi:mucin-4 [Bactrocera oleae]|uniref:mucin-4 n=1 Tax=Bactrocera oleae TaxID=104688 RepID=UPI00387E9A29